MPALHLEYLSDRLRTHEERINELEASREALDREISQREAANASGAFSHEVKLHGVERLVAQRLTIEREIRVHAALLAFGRDQRTIDTFAEVVTDPVVAREAAANPRAFASDRGIVIPPNMNVDVDVSPSDEVSVRVEYGDDLAPFILVWARDGFSMPRQ